MHTVHTLERERERKGEVSTNSIVCVNYQVTVHTCEYPSRDTYAAQRRSAARARVGRGASGPLVRDQKMALKIWLQL